MSAEYPIPAPKEEPVFGLSIVSAEELKAAQDAATERRKQALADEPTQAEVLEVPGKATVEAKASAAEKRKGGA